MCNPQAVWVTWGYIRLALALPSLTRGPVVAWLPLSCHGHMHTIEDDLIFWKASLTTSLLFVSEKLKWYGTFLVVGYHLYMHTSILTSHSDMTGTILSATTIVLVFTIIDVVSGVHESFRPISTEWPLMWGQGYSILVNKFFFEFWMEGCHCS